MTERILVSPREACIMLSIGNTHLFKLIKEGKLESFKDGKSRKITVRSIHDYVEAKLLEAAGEEL